MRDGLGRKGIIQVVRGKEAGAQRGVLGMGEGDETVG